MSDTYQAIYDAVRSRIGGGNLGEILREVAGQAFDISHSQAMVRDEFLRVAYDLQRPSVQYRPSLSPDGSKWVALYGPNLEEGVAGVGDTPAAAMEDFDKNWRAQRTPNAVCEPPQPR